MYTYIAIVFRLMDCELYEKQYDILVVIFHASGIKTGLQTIMTALVV